MDPSAAPADCVRHALARAEEAVWADLALGLLAERDPARLTGVLAAALRAWLGDVLVALHGRGEEGLELEGEVELSSPEAAALGEIVAACARASTSLCLGRGELERHPDRRLAGLRALVCVPLGSGARPQGVLSVLSRVHESLADERARIERTGELLAAAHARAAGERELRGSEARLRSFLDHATDAIFLHARDGVVLDVNRQACAALGYTRAELISKTVFDIDPDITPAGLASVVERLDAGEVLGFDSHHRRKDGTTFPVEVRIRPFWVGRERYGIALARDITARKRAEETLRRSEMRLAEAQEIGGFGSFEVDVGRWRGACSTGLLRVLGLADEDAFRDFRAFLERHVHPADRARTERLRAEALATSEPTELDFRYLHPDGSERVLHVRRRVELGNDGRPVKLIGTAQDITARRRAEMAQRLSEEALRRAQALARVGSWVFEVDAQRFTCTEESRVLCGWARSQGSEPDFLAPVHPADRAAIEARWEAAKAGLGFALEHRILVDDQVRWVDVRAEPELDADGRTLRITGVTQDITARRLLEEELRQAQKMEAVGQLAGGVAHDFNNLMTIVNGFCDLLLADLNPDEQHWRQVAAIRDAGRRAGLLTRQLLAFSRKQILEPVVLDLNRILERAHALLQRLIGEDVRIETRLTPDLWSVRVDAGQIEQVIVNLALNARDAMPTGGRLTLATFNVAPGSVELPAGSGSRRCVELRVSDDGEGMSPEVRARAFEPFFTTKGPGKGTGLGLAMVYGIVVQSGGHVRIESEPGLGTTCRVFLPALETPSGPPGVLVPAARVPARRPSAGSTILLVEDEPGVLSVVKRTLEAHGHVVLAACDAELAERAARAHEGEIDLVLTDVVMPGMGGPRLVESLRSGQPGLRALFMSGYADDAVLRHGIQRAADRLLQKPFTPEELLACVREVLEAPGPIHR